MPKPNLKIKKPNLKNNFLDWILWPILEVVAFWFAAPETSYLTSKNKKPSKLENIFAISFLILFFIILIGMIYYFR